MRRKSAKIRDKRVLQDKLDRGVALVKRVPLVTPAVSRDLMRHARASVLDGIADGFGDIVSQVKSGEIIPDQLIGISSKTVLAGLVLLLAVKLKKAAA